MKKIILGMVFVFLTIIITNANNNTTKEMGGSVSCYEQAEAHVRIEQYYYYLTYEDQYNYFTEEYDKCISDGRQDEIQFP